MFPQGGTEQSIAGIESFKLVAVYEPDSGTILHLHTVVVFEGGRPVSDDEATEAARAEAERLGHKGDLGIKLSTNPQHGELPHRIDPSTGEFVPIELPELMRRGLAARDGTA